VTKTAGNLIPGVTRPNFHTGLTGIPYYYVVTAVNSYGESWVSLEVEVMPQLPPPSPTNLTATNRPHTLAVDIEWIGVPGVIDYRLYRCQAWIISTPDVNNIGQCLWMPVVIYREAETLFVDRDVEHGRAYRYHVIASNRFGESNPSEDVAIITPYRVF
jgi:fibronectin type 3 domain-containing protein